MAIILVALTIVLTIYVSMVFLSYSNALIHGKAIANTNSLKLYIDNCRNHSRVAAVSMARRPEAVNAIKNRDREEILRIFTSVCPLYQVDYFTVTDDKGTVLARTHHFDHFDDSVLNQRNITDAMAGNVSTYFETGTVARVSVRTGVPVYDTDGTILGVISTGIRFDTNEAVDQLKELFRSDVAVFVKDEREIATRIATTITDEKGERISGTALDPAIAKAVIGEKREYFGDADIFGQTYKTFYMPLLDAKDEVFAVFFVGTPISEIKTQAEVLIRNIIIIGLIGLMVSIIILYSVISSISKPLIVLSNEMDNIANGQLNIVIDVKNDDEIGHAGKSLQKVVDIMYKLIDDINVAIFEHEKGNTDYRLDTNAFRGDYRLLADRIMALSSSGLKDQLTGIPNRRSFDSRLNLEWHRAMRDKTPLSILMLDVDGFKTYNDTYGHQQGDVVLQTVAKALTLPLKRGFDFTARWGGEEFAVLLPNTSSKGALHVAEMIRTGVENLQIPCIGGGDAKKVTISVGVSTQIPISSSTCENLISRADAALYCAKRTGRNRSCPYEGDE